MPSSRRRSRLPGRAARALVRSLTRQRSRRSYPAPPDSAAAASAARPAELSAELAGGRPRSSASSGAASARAPRRKPLAVSGAAARLLACGGLRATARRAGGSARPAPRPRRARTAGRARQRRGSSPATARRASAARPARPQRCFRSRGPPRRRTRRSGRLRVARRATGTRGGAARHRSLGGAAAEASEPLGSGRCVSAAPCGAQAPRPQPSPRAVLPAGGRATAARRAGAAGEAPGAAGPGALRSVSVPPERGLLGSPFSGASLGSFVFEHAGGSPVTLPGAASWSGRGPRLARCRCSGARAPHGSCCLTRRHRPWTGHDESLLVGARLRPDPGGSLVLRRRVDAVYAGSSAPLGQPCVLAPSAGARRGRARTGRSPCRSPRRAAPAPAWSPLRGPAARGRPSHGGRTGRRRVVRRVSDAEQPAAVSHRDRLRTYRYLRLPAVTSTTCSSAPRVTATSSRVTARARRKCARRSSSCRSTSTGIRGEERRDRPLGIVRLDTVEPELPHGRLQPVGESGSPGLDRIDQIEPRRQRLVQQGAQLLGIAGLGEGDLQVLGLAADAGGCGIGVRDLGVRGETRRVRHRHLGPAQRPLESALEVAVAGEPEAAALGVAEANALHRGCGRRAFGLSLAQWFTPQCLGAGRHSVGDDRPRVCTGSKGADIRTGTIRARILLAVVGAVVRVLRPRVRARSRSASCVPERTSPLTGTRGVLRDGKDLLDIRA